jgi:hypothetical protein
MRTRRIVLRAAILAWMVVVYLSYWATYVPIAR